MNLRFENTDKVFPSIDYNGPVNSSLVIAQTRNGRTYFKIKQ